MKVGERINLAIIHVLTLHPGIVTASLVRLAGKELGMELHRNTFTHRVKEMRKAGLVVSVTASLKHTKGSKHFLASDAAVSTEPTFMCQEDVEYYDAVEEQRRANISKAALLKPSNTRAAAKATAGGRVVQLTNTSRWATDTIGSASDVRGEQNQYHPSAAFSVRSQRKHY